MTVFVSQVIMGVLYMPAKKFSNIHIFSLIYGQSKTLLPFQPVPSPGGTAELVVNRGQHVSDMVFQCLESNLLQVLINIDLMACVGNKKHIYDKNY